MAIASEFTQTVDLHDVIRVKCNFTFKCNGLSCKMHPAKVAHDIHVIQPSRSTKQF